MGVCCDYCEAIVSQPQAEVAIKAEEPAPKEDFAALVLAQVLPVVSGWASSSSSVSLAPSIPPKKLHNFLHTCRSSPTESWLEQCATIRSQQAVNGILPMVPGIFAYVDCTVFGGGKDGLAFAWGGLAFKELGVNPIHVSWEDALAVTRGDPVSSVGVINSVFQVSNGTKISLSGSDVSGAMLGELVAALNNAGKSWPPTDRW